MKKINTAMIIKLKKCEGLKAETQCIRLRENYFKRPFQISQTETVGLTLPPASSQSAHILFPNLWED